MNMHDTFLFTQMGLSVICLAYTLAGAYHLIRPKNEIPSDIPVLVIYTLLISISINDAILYIEEVKPFWIIQLVLILMHSSYFLLRRKTKAAQSM